MQHYATHIYLFIRLIAMLHIEIVNPKKQKKKTVKRIVQESAISILS